MSVDQSIRLPEHLRPDRSNVHLLEHPVAGPAMPKPYHDLRLAFIPF